MGDRRWGQGGWGSGIGQRREEGLDERGEAPPPYMPEEPRPAHVRSRSRGNHDVQDVDNDRADGDNPAVGLSIPLHTLSRDERKPPDYEHRPRSGTPDELQSVQTLLNGDASKAMVIQDGTSLALSNPLNAWRSS